MKKVFLELDVFSGRENPRWEFPYESALELYNQINQFPVTAPTKDFDGLGYRGFILTIERDREQKIICYVYSDRIKISEGKIIHYKKDAHYTIERIFLQSSKNKIENLIFENINKQISNRR